MTEETRDQSPAPPEAHPDEAVLQERLRQRFRRCGTDGAQGELFRAVLAYQRDKAPPP